LLQFSICTVAHISHGDIGVM